MSVSYLQPPWKGFLQLRSSHFLQVGQVTSLILKYFQRLWEKGRNMETRGKEHTAKAERLRSALDEFDRLQIPRLQVCRIQLPSQQALPTALTAPSWVVAADWHWAGQVQTSTSCTGRCWSCSISWLLRWCPLLTQTYYHVFLTCSILCKCPLPVCGVVGISDVLLSSVVEGREAVVLGEAERVRN